MPKKGQYHLLKDQQQVIFKLIGMVIKISLPFLSFCPSLIWKLLWHKKGYFILLKVINGPKNCFYLTKFQYLSEPQRIHWPFLQFLKARFFYCFAGSCNAQNFTYTADTLYPVLLSPRLYVLGWLMWCTHYLCWYSPAFIWWRSSTMIRLTVALR